MSRPSPVAHRACRAVLLSAACLVGLAPAVAAQTTESKGRTPPAGAAPTEDVAAAHREAIQRLAFMVGDWQGEGWIDRGGQRLEFRGGERVQRKLDGLALLVEGNFTSRPPGADREVPVHQTLGVIAWDERSRSYRLSTWLASGATGNHELELLESGWRWGLDVPNGTVRYTATFMPDGEWVEVGEFSPDDRNWHKFFEMRLRKGSTSQ